MMNNDFEKNASYTTRLTAQHTAVALRGEVLAHRFEDGKIVESVTWEEGQTVIAGPDRNAGFRGIETTVRLNGFSATVSTGAVQVLRVM